ncbi:unnamed protein product [Cylindrotheca closterium]|uniref:Orc1-like AAA ATPase domain-containing protein n=1 Tax=Cylindrotheca closterium TaxID=2856 RepID=A0AAD2D1D8_9STRA|nr:unnamed protein product [Cylindrotheca closterium]
MKTIADDSSGPKWIIQGLYGRQDELDMLNKIAEGGTSACVLIEGCDGSGKTALVNAADWKGKEWVFIAEKFESHLRLEPYSALTRAIAELVEIWCAENEKSPDDCRMSELLDLLEQDMDLLQALIPGLFRVIDKFTQRVHRSRRQDMLRAKSKGHISRSQKMLHRTSSIKDLTSSRRQRGQLGDEMMGGDSAAITASFIRLISFLASTKPVVLSIDAVHHADTSSMEILKLMAHTASTNPAKFSSTQIILVLTYTELLEQNKFALKTIKSIKTFQSNVHCVQLKHWDIDTVNELVTSLVKAEPEETLPLSKVIHKKTGGNPFAVFQFLRVARESGKIKFSSMTYKWEWEDVEILDQHAAVSDNVADILASSMIKLCFATKHALKVASCLGHIIPKDVLIEYFAEGHGEEFKQSSNSNAIALQEEGLVELLEGAVKVGILVKSTTDGAYMWSNDRLQQAAYDCMPVTMRNELHRNLGRLLWELGLVRDEDWMIFMAATQMNTYAEQQVDLCLGNEVAELNLQAATLSLNKGAIYPALELLLNAEKHMEKATDRWKDNYEFTLDLLTTLAEAKFRIGETQTAMDIAIEVVQNAKTHCDTFPAHIIMLQCVVSGNDRNYDKGVERTLLLLKFYGDKHIWKFYPGKETVEKTKLKAKLKKLLPNGHVNGLLDLSEMVDKGALRIQTLLVNHLAVYAAYSPTYKSLSWFASARALKGTCKQGISPVTNLAVIQMATHLRVDGHYKSASKYAEVALTLTESLPRKLGSDHGQVRLTACTSVLSAVRSFNNCLNELMECRSDFLRAGLARESIGVAIDYTITYLCVGLSLESAKSDLVAHTEDAIHYGCPYFVEQKMMSLHQTILNLTDDVENPTFLHGEVMDQDDELEKVEGLGALRIRLGMDACRLMLCCVFGDWDAAGALIEDLEEYMDERDGFLMRDHFRRCYLGLAAFALSRETKDSKLRKKYLTEGKKMLKSFIKEMKHGSVNAFPIVAMLEAEKNPSKQSYDKAITACARLGLVHHEAYMCERAAEMFLAEDDKDWCKYYIRQAILLYGEWGATGKVNRLTKDYREILGGDSIQDSVNTSLQSRCRYSSKQLDSLRTIDWRSFHKSVHDNSIDFSSSFRSVTSASTFEASDRSFSSSKSKINSSFSNTVSSIKSRTKMSSMSTKSSKAVPCS